MRFHITKSTDDIGHFQLEIDDTRTRKIDTVEVEERFQIRRLDKLNSKPGLKINECR
jgi:hypothetical protein